MRTDVKVGLISLFVVVLALVMYFAISQAKQHRTPEPIPAVHPGLVTDTSPDGTGHAGAGTGGIVVPAPGAGTQTATTAMAVGPGSPAPWGFTQPAPTTATTLPPPPPVVATRAWDTPVVTTSRWTIPTTRTYVADTLPYDTHVTTTRTGTHTGTPTDGITGAAGTYKIKAGDTFLKIAAAQHVSVKGLETANPGVDSRHLKINQVIKLPAASTTATTSRSTVMDSGTPATRPATTTTSALVGTDYTVKAGDTLAKIAKKAYGDEKQWRLIVKANRSKIPDEDTITPGMVLRIPNKP